MLVIFHVSKIERYLQSISHEIGQGQWWRRELQNHALLGNRSRTICEDTDLAGINRDAHLWIVS